MSGIPFSTIVDWLRADGHLTDAAVVVGSPLAREVDSACVDSRLARPGCLFVALPGQRTDGHNFVDHAVQGGAFAALVAADRVAAVRRSIYGSVHLLPVDDTLAALQSIAKRWRGEFPALTRIGITGSNGKTSTKELLAAVLGRVAPTEHSHGNYNSDIGCPIELLRIRAEHRYGVFEMGMNRVGEIRLLAELVDPSIALITNIGRAHIGMVGSQEGIAREKREIFGYFSGSQIALVPAADAFADFLVENVHGTIVRFGKESAGVVSVRPNGIDGSTLVCPEGPIELRLPGDRMVANALAVITVARLLDVPFEEIRAGIESVQPVFGRAEVIRGDVTVIQDCYNANPESMRAALALLAESAARGRRIAVLGAMKELGNESDAAHREMLDAAIAAGPDEIVLVGDEFVSAAREAGVSDAASDERPVVRAFGDAEWEGVVAAVSTVEKGDLVLLKGSRALALERLTPVVIDRLEERIS